MSYFSLQLVFLLILTTHATQSQNPVSAEDYSQQGIASFEKNDFEAAIGNFTKAIEMNGPNLEFCFYFRGMALYRLSRLDEALSDLNKAITLKQHPRFYDDRGNMLAQKGDLDGAIADLNKAIEIEPKYAKAYGDRAIVELIRGDDTAAELDLKRCFELDRTLESQFKTAASQLRQQASFRPDYKKPSDVDIVKFNWKETRPQAPVPAPNPAIPVTTSGVSHTGLRVLGNATSTSQPDPPPFLDPLNAPMPAPREPTKRSRGVYYKFTASLKNTGIKTIAGVEWAYVFYPKDRSQPIAFAFATKANIPPGKDRELTDQILSTVNSEANSKFPTKDNRELFEEKIVILRLEYSDGSSWQISGAVNTHKTLDRKN